MTDNVYHTKYLTDVQLTMMLAVDSLSPATFDARHSSVDASWGLSRPITYCSWPISRSCRGYTIPTSVNLPSSKNVLTLWRPLWPYGFNYKASCARPGYAVICNFWHPGTMTLRTVCQRARMSKITNDGLTRSGTGCFIAVPVWQQWASKS